MYASGNVHDDGQLARDSAKPFERKRRRLYYTLTEEGRERERGREEEENSQW